MLFNWEISLGSIMAVITMAGGVASFYFGTKNDTRQLKDSLTGFKDDFAAAMLKLDKNIETLNNVVMQQALGNQRQDNYEKRTDAAIQDIKADLRELKHGQGFIKEQA